MWNMFKVNNKDTRTTPVANNVSILNFKQVNASWDLTFQMLVCLFPSFNITKSLE